MTATGSWHDFAADMVNDLLNSATVHRELRVDILQRATRGGSGPRGPNAARALCKETQDMTIAKPAGKPARPFFSSGPCAKPPGWDASKLKTDSLGRSHRAKIGKSRLQLAIDLTRDVLQVPDTHRIGIVPGSDTGAVEIVGAVAREAAADHIVHAAARHNVQAVIDELEMFVCFVGDGMVK